MHQASEALRSEVGVRAGAMRTSVRQAVDTTLDRVTPSPERTVKARGWVGVGSAESVQSVTKEQAALHEQLERAERQLLYLEQRAGLIEGRAAVE